MPPQVSLVSHEQRPPRTAVVVVGLMSTGRGPRLAPGAEWIDEQLQGRLLAAARAVGATGAADEVTKVPTLGLTGVELVVLTGVGPAARLDDEALRRAAGAALRQLDGRRPVHLAIEAAGSSLGALVEGALLGSYRYETYKSAELAPAPRRITVAVGEPARERAVLRRARALATAITTTRDLVNTPPNDLYPASFAARAQQLAAGTAVTVEVLDERALQRDGYGGIVGVGAGSARPPRLVRLSYAPVGARHHVALVGKGITFDSGGLNLKRANMALMKSDMAGAAAALATTLAAAALRLPVRVTATLPLAENMISGGSYRPSDVLLLRSGARVEVTNTDAEGRLVLADAITRALEDEPDALLEVSTLTGAQVVALGPRVIGAMGAPELRDRVAALGSAAGEAVWAMPVPDELHAGLDSSVADLVNLPSHQWAGMLYGGQFLAEFMPEALPWVHLDIAGPAFNEGAAHGYTPRGATGAAVRTLLATLTEFAA